MRVIDAYFARTDLPPHVRKLPREARSNAAYNATRACITSAPREARAYFGESLRSCSGAYLRW